MKLLLVCYAGMSTSMMAEKLEAEGMRRGLDLTVQAVPMANLESYLDDVDIVLLGPQVRFAEDDVKKAVDGKCPLEVMSPQDFGMMNASHVIDQIEKALGM
ncbi:PTS sugar transporter subunit IIB [Olsenella uli]|uniref:PTS sugar transporter subunit IIB n=1 Tax=Olsenella uli TaxID=133926 RepID=UPI000449923F|nr:PTS sugar transporter subunit IIB [Olsenella uli]EUB30528.1 putative lichenan-specific phosphotransferase enzyme IIB component [Olsenella uli MSTE5]